MEIHCECLMLLKRRYRRLIDWLIDRCSGWRWWLLFQHQSTVKCGLIKFLNAQSIAPIEIHRQLCQVYGNTHLQKFGLEVFNIIHPIGRTSRPVISIISYNSRNYCPVSVSVFRMTERRRWVKQWFQSQAAYFYDTGYKSWSHGMTNVSVPEVKNSPTLAVSLTKNLSIKLGFENLVFRSRPSVG